MVFPLEVVGAGKQEIICRIHIKYANNMDLKTETDDLDGLRMWELLIKVGCH
jgi:hypothetical protein